MPDESKPNYQPSGSRPYSPSDESTASLGGPLFGPPSQPDELGTLGHFRIHIMCCRESSDSKFMLDRELRDFEAVRFMAGLRFVV